MRPSLADVERLARGLAATRRGTGSRSVPHRLNTDEHQSFERAKQHGFAVVKGSGQRRERKSAPLLNTLRQRADALDRCMVWCQQGLLSDDTDVCCIDFSPRRLADATELLELRERATRLALGVEGVQLLDDSPALVPCSEEARLRWPIWRLPAQVTRFGSAHDEPQVTKRLAKALALEFDLGDGSSSAAAKKRERYDDD